MENRFIITISDINKSVSYNLHKLVRNAFVLIIIFVLTIIGGSFWFITSLKEKYENFEKTKKHEIELLTQKEEKLIIQNKMYSIEIKNKENDIDELSTKLDGIEEIIGMKKDDNSDLITRASLAKISLSQKMYMLEIIPSGYPLKGEIVYTSSYGYRVHPLAQKRKFHYGSDFRAQRRTMVYATADGVVNFVQDKNRGSFGRIVKISHNYGFETIFAHLEKTLVKAGDIVHKGDLIALSGKSGKSSGPHLHYEVKYGIKSLDPKPFLEWSLNNYESIFEKQRRVKWESLVDLMNKHKKKQEIQ